MNQHLSALLSLILLALPIAATAYPAILVNKTKHDISYAIGGVCLERAIAKNSSNFLTDNEFQVLCGSNTENCLLEVYQSKKCNKLPIAGVVVAIHTGPKEIYLVADKYAVAINPTNNVVTISQAIN